MFYLFEIFHAIRCSYSDWFLFYFINSTFILPDDCVMREFYCIAVIEYMIAGKTLLNYNNLLFLNDHQKNEKIIYKYFKDKYKERKQEPTF